MIDYYIVCTVRPEDIIETVGARSDLDETKAEQKLSRSQVISDIKEGKTVYTAYKKNGELVKGNLVQVFKIGDKEYIKTEKNNTQADNLDNIRECNFN